MDVSLIKCLKADAYDLLLKMNGHLDKAEEFKQKIFELEKQIQELESCDEAEIG